MQILFKAILIVLVFFIAVPSVSADRCASADEIRDRKISKVYEWTVDDGITLDDLLSVKNLFAVSVENNGEFVSCKYKNDNRFLKLDGLPKKEKCSIITSSGKWFTIGTGRVICYEKDAERCLFDIECL